MTSLLLSTLGVTSWINTTPQGMIKIFGLHGRCVIRPPHIPLVLYSFPAFSYMIETALTAASSWLTIPDLLCACFIPCFDFVPANRKRIISFCYRESHTTAEIADGIISGAWLSEMRTEPDHARLASLEQHVFTCILAPCIMHIPKMKCFDYLCAVTYSQEIYHLRQLFTQLPFYRDLPSQRL